MRYYTLQEMIDYAAARVKEGANGLTIRDELQSLADERIGIHEFSLIYSNALRKNNEGRITSDA